MKFTIKMSAAGIERFLKQSHRKVVPSGLMVTLTLVDWRLVVLVVLAPHIFLDTQ